MSVCMLRHPSWTPRSKQAGTHHHTQGPGRDGLPDPWHRRRRGIGWPSRVLHDAKDIALWQDRYTPPPSKADSVAARFPILGSHFELVEKQPATQPALCNIHLFNTGAVVSTGIVAGGLNGMPWGISRLIAGLSADFYRAEVDSISAAFAGFDEPDAWENVKTQA